MELEERIKDVRLRLLRAETEALRQPGTVKLLAVSKTQGIDKIIRAYNAGLSAFGENYLQEALIKINTLSYLPIEWHFIGTIQSNKAKKIAKNFSWVHSVYRNVIAEHLNLHRPSELPPLNVCLQLNLDEDKEAGISPAKIAELINQVIILPRLKLRGFMVIPAANLNEEQQFHTFLQVRDMMTKFNTELGLNLDTLSMGMSDDMAEAVRAGSTMVRIGRAIFGERTA